MKVLRGFVLCLYCLMLAITGVSFLMGSTCKAAISDIVVYKSEDKITDAIASVYPNLKGDELDKVFDYLENDKDLRKIADMYVDAAIKVASSNKNKDKTLEEMLSETQTSEMNNAVSSFTDNLVSKVFGDEANNISGIAATLYNAVKQSVSLKVTEAVSYYTAGVVDGMSTKKSSASIHYLTVTSVMGSGSRKVISTDTGSDTTGSSDAGTSYGGTAAEIQQQIKDKEKEIRDYQLDIKETNLEIKDIQKKLNNQTIKSTLNGVVKTVGDPEKESNDGKPLIQVVSSEGLYVQGTVSESKMNKLKVGATLSGYSYDNGVSFTAEVREISPYPSDNGQDGANASSYPFTAYIADASGLSNNSWAELTLLDEGDGQGQGIYLEKPFVRTENGQYYVMKDDGTGHLTKQIVQVGGIQYGSSYQITGGLSMDDKITFPYGKDVREGAKTEEGTLDDLYNY